MDGSLVVSRVAPLISVFAVGFPINVTVGQIGMLLTLLLLEQPFSWRCSGWGSGFSSIARQT